MAEEKKKQQIHGPVQEHRAGHMTYEEGTRGGVSASFFCPGKPANKKSIPNAKKFE